MGHSYSLIGVFADRQALSVRSGMCFTYVSQRTGNTGELGRQLYVASHPFNPHSFAAIVFAHSSWCNTNHIIFQPSLHLVISLLPTMMKSYDKPNHSDIVDDSKPPVSKKKGGKPEDAKEIAGFLLSLKNQRSVSPDVNDSQPTAAEPEVTPADQNPPPVMVPYGAPVMPYPPYMGQAPYPYPPYPVGHSMAHLGYAGGALPADASAAKQQQQAKSGASATKAKKPRAPKAIPESPNTEDAAAIEQFKEYNFAELIEGSTLVQLKDRDLVPDPLYVAMSQMKHCHLTQSDRVGCYKGRDLDFVGMCCKHCGGQPGFGRYFPNSLRSLAQTTTSQTILKHISSKCRFCPPAIRSAVLDLQRQQAIREGMATGRPRYGSRKIFFQRVWSRLHAGSLGKDAEEGTEEDGLAGEEDGGDKSDDTASLEEEHISLAGSNALTEVPVVSTEYAPPEEEAAGLAEEADTDDKGFKRKSRFGALPIMSNSKRSKVEVQEV
jgi:hypothetical protein